MTPKPKIKDWAKKKITRIYPIAGDIVSHAFYTGVVIEISEMYGMKYAYVLPFRKKAKPFNVPFHLFHPDMGLLKIMRHA